MIQRRLAMVTACTRMMCKFKTFHILKVIMAQKFHIWREIWLSMFMKLMGTLIQFSKLFSKTHYKSCQKSKTKNLTSTKSKETYHLQRNPHKAISSFLSRNLGQERVGSSMDESCPLEMNERDVLRQTKAEGVHHLLTYKKF